MTGPTGGTGGAGAQGSTGLQGFTGLVRTGAVVSSSYVPVSNGSTYVNSPVQVSGSNVGIGASPGSNTLLISAPWPVLNIQATTATSYSYLEFENTTTWLMGVENSAGGGLISGSSPYALAIGSESGTYPIQFGINDHILLTMTGQGYVGIGTTSPSVALQVSAPSGVQPLTLNSTLFEVAQLIGPSYPSLLLTYNGGGSDYISNYNNTGLGFSANTPTWYTAHMFIANSGNVGIGTTAPGLKEHIIGALGFPATTGSTQTGVLRLQGYGSNGVLDFSVNAGLGASLQATNQVDFTQTYVLALNPNGGNVGIGTTNPLATLDVYGTGSAGAIDAVLACANNDFNFQLVTVKSVATNNSGDVMDKIGLAYSNNTNNNSFIRFHRGGSTTGGFMSFSVNNDAEVVRIDTAGNVGIGTAQAPDILSMYGVI